MNVTAKSVNFGNGLLAIGLNDTRIPLGIDRTHSILFADSAFNFE